MNQILTAAAVAVGLSTQLVSPSSSPFVARQVECGGDWPCTDLVTAVDRCAVDCIAAAAVTVGCGATDFDCRCANRGAITDAAFSCVWAACVVGEDVSKVIGVIEQTDALCACVADAPGGPSPVCSAPSSSTSAAPPSVTPAPCGGEWTCSNEVTAQPTCGLPCWEAGAADQGCGQFDYDCQCEKAEPISGFAWDCLVANCGLDGGNDIGPVLAFFDAKEALCNCNAASEDSPPAPCPISSSTISAPVSSVTPPPTCGGTWGCDAVVDTIPACGKQCLVQAALDIGCAPGDRACECENAGELGGVVFPCLETNCVVGENYDDLFAVFDSMEAICVCLEEFPGGASTACPSSGSSTVISSSSVVISSSSEVITTSSIISGSDIPSSTSSIASSTPVSGSGSSGIPSSTSAIVSSSTTGSGAVTKPTTSTTCTTSTYGVKPYPSGGGGKDYPTGGDDSGKPGKDYPSGGDSDDTPVNDSPIKDSPIVDDNSDTPGTDSPANDTPTGDVSDVSPGGGSGSGAEAPIVTAGAYPGKELSTAGTVFAALFAALRLL